MTTQRDYARPGDYAECVRLHRQFGTSYFFASRFFPPEIKRRVDSLYGFVRVADEWVDNPGSLTPLQSEELLDCFRHELIDGLGGVAPSHPVMRAFLSSATAVGMSADEPLCFLHAMAKDLKQTRYGSYADLCEYMRGSAAAVGLMMLKMMEVDANADQEQAAIHLANAMQLTNFLRDIGEDWERGRLYMPLDEMAEFGVSERDIDEARLTPEFRRFMGFQISRARELYAASDAEIAKLPLSARRPVRLARELYSKILDRIEAHDYDVFGRRARVSRLAKVRAAAWVLVRP